MSFEQMMNHRSPSRVQCCLATSLSFLIVVPTLCITLALTLYPDSGPWYSSNLNSTNMNRTISLSAGLASVDIRTATMSVEWSIDSDTCSDNCTPVNIFFDTNLSPSDDKYDKGPSNNNRPSEPIFLWNATGFSSGDILANSALFRMKLNIYPWYEYDFQGPRYRIKDGNLANYPFDCYQSEIFAFAQEASTNKTVSLVLSSVSRLIGDFKITTDGMTSYIEGPDGEIIYAVLNLQRSPVIIGYCLVITATIWMVTLMICLITITTVVFGYRQRNEIIIAPIGTVFAFTQLRTTMPGAPEGFGDVLDMAGLLPCLILLTICAVATVGICLFTDPDDSSRRTFTGDEFVNVLHVFIRRIWNTANARAQRARLRIRMARWKTSNVIEIPLANLDR
ncbi:hypothetical protein EDD85DRAFT_132828 [Armillaria nabsnona]|nr:hypothetical protein EDD85DRAFT_132828 [Armillaria nabsnona]